MINPTISVEGGFLMFMHSCSKCGQSSVNGELCSACNILETGEDVMIRQNQALASPSYRQNDVKNIYRMTLAVILLLAIVFICLAYDDIATRHNLSSQTIIHQKTHGSR